MIWIKIPIDEKKKESTKKVTMRDILRSRDPDEALTKIMHYVSRDSRITVYSKEQKALLLFVQYMDESFNPADYVKEAIEEKMKSDPKFKELYDYIKNIISSNKV